MAFGFSPVAGLTTELFGAWDVQFTADGDTIGIIPHGFSPNPITSPGGGSQPGSYGFGANPHFVIATPVHADFYAQDIWLSWDDTNITINKGSTAADSGSASNTVRVIAGFYTQGLVRSGIGGTISP